MAFLREGAYFLVINFGDTFFGAARPAIRRAHKKTQFLLWSGHRETHWLMLTKSPTSPTEATADISLSWYLTARIASKKFLIGWQLVGVHSFHKDNGSLILTLVLILILILVILIRAKENMSSSKQLRSIKQRKTDDKLPFRIVKIAGMVKLKHWKMIKLSCHEICPKNHITFRIHFILIGGCIGWWTTIGGELLNESSWQERPLTRG